MEKVKIIYKGKEAEIELTEDMLEMFKDKKSYKRFVPKVGEEYWWMGAGFYGIYVAKYVYKDCNIDNGNIALGNCYKTEADALFEVEKRKLLVELQDFADENNDEIDWDDEDSEKYFIYYDCKDKQLDVGCVWATKEPNIYFSSENLANKAIEKFGDRIKKYIYEVNDD